MGELPSILLRILKGRGIDAVDYERYFNPSLNDLVAPCDLPGVSEATNVILNAVQRGGSIVVFGDYDCDGVCATAIMVKAISALPNAHVEPFIPDRLSEGYGMTAESVERMLRENPDVRLVVTVDNGVNSVDEVAGLKARGISVVITDHHLPGETLPAADALIDPKVATPPALEDLCGAGVAFMLANRLISEAKAQGLYTGPNVAGPLLVLAGLATVTDVMPLIGQNRILVAEALRRFRTLAPLGLRELFDRAARAGTVTLTSRDFGFMLGPRINASGRLASSMEALELILADDREIARELARIVDLRNAERKSIEQKMTDIAMSRIVPDASAQVIEMTDGHPGVAGIVAARVMERLNTEAFEKGKPLVPVCVIANGHGSARAPVGLNIRDAMESCRAVLDRFGGHAAAGGFSVHEGCVTEFRRLLCEYCSAHASALPATDDNSPYAPEAWVEPRELTMDLAQWFLKMEPFGEANPEPVLGLRNIIVTDVKPLGADGRHLALAVPGRLRAVWWNHGDLVEEIRATSTQPRDITFTVVISDYGEPHVELRIQRLTLTHNPA